MSAVIRRAGADDVDFIAWTILMSQRGHRSRGWVDIALGRPEPECLAFIGRIAAAPALSLWQVSRFWIADVDGRAAAALCALPAGIARTTIRPVIQETLQAMGVDAGEQAAIRQRGAYLARCWPAGADADWLIEHVAADSSHRGQGLVQALLAHALDEGRAAGFTRAWIPVYIGNEAAERCYTRAGFVFAEEKRDAACEALTGAPGFRRFERAL